MYVARFDVGHTRRAGDIQGREEGVDGRGRWEEDGEDSRHKAGGFRSGSAFVFIERFHKRTILKQLATLCSVEKKPLSATFHSAHTCNCSSIWLTDRSPGRTLAAANAENRKHPAASARPVRREGKNREAIGEDVGRRTTTSRSSRSWGRALKAGSLSPARTT